MAELRKLPANSLKIGTWPTPEHPAGGLMIDTVPLPEQPSPGIIPVARLLGGELRDKVIEGMPRVKIINGIDGGIRNPHLHIKDEVVLLNRARFKEVVSQIAGELAGKLTESADFAETARAISHLFPEHK